MTSPQYICSKVSPPEYKPEPEPEHNYVADTQECANLNH